jgi:hypothetical protein
MLIKEWAMFRKRSPKTRSMLVLALLGALSLSAALGAASQSTVYLPLLAVPPSPTPPSVAGVTAQNFSGYYDLGDYMLFGEVVNTLDVPVYDVELAITYRDAAGTIVATDQAAASLRRIEPGASAPFFNPYYSAPPGITQYTVTATWSLSLPVEWRPITILTTTKQVGSLGVIVSGTGRNDAGQAVSNVLLVASFRDAAGKVVDVQYDYPLIGALQPGQSFEYTIETFNDALADTAVLVQGQGSIEP